MLTTFVQWKEQCSKSNSSIYFILLYINLHAIAFEVALSTNKLEESVVFF